MESNHHTSCCNSTDKCGGFFSQYWYGQVSLGTSICTYVGLGILLAGGGMFMRHNYLGMALITLFVFLNPWLVIGLWRSACKCSKEACSKISCGYIVKVLLILKFMGATAFIMHCLMCCMDHKAMMMHNNSDKQVVSSTSKQEVKQSSGKKETTVTKTKKGKK